MMDETVKAKIDTFFGNYSQRHLKKGQGIFFAGEDIASIYKLDSGRIGQYNIAPSGQKTTLNVFKPPAFLPLAYAVRGVPTPHFFEALTDCSVRIAPVKPTLEFLLANGDVMYDLLQRLYSGIDGLQQRGMLMASGDARSRVILELIISANRFGVMTDSGAHNLPLTETELALSAGLSRETVSREVSKLKDKGIVKVAHNEIEIPDLATLKALSVE